MYSDRSISISRRVSSSPCSARPAAGKSTLLHVIAGLVEPTAGTVLLFGQAPRDVARAKNIGWIPQSPALLPWLSVRSNATLSTRVNRRADRAPVAGRSLADPDEILARMGLTAFSHLRPAALSGGLRQRAAIARGFVQGAAVMLMDEPFSALDEITREAVREQTLSIWDEHRKTVVFVTHSATEAVLISDRIVLMSPAPGRIHSIMTVDLPRPRGDHVTETARFSLLVQDLKSRLRSMAQ